MRSLRGTQMPIIETIENIISSTPLLIYDESKLYPALFKARSVFFLDTCFITRIYEIDINLIIESFDRLAGSKDTYLFVITELVLYELKDKDSDNLQKNAENFFCKLISKGHTIVVVKEEHLVSLLCSYSEKKIAEMNRMFCDIIRDNSANLCKIGELIKKDTKVPCGNIMSSMYDVPDKYDFIKNTLIYIKEQKKTQDSLAEDVLCIFLALFFKVYDGVLRGHFYFCSNDYKAITRIRKTFRISLRNVVIKFDALHGFGLVQYMINSKMVDNEEDAVCMLKKIISNEPFSVSVRQQLPGTSYLDRMTVEEAVHLMFQGYEIDIP